MEYPSDKLDQNARKLFMLDGLGAVFSACMLGIFWVRWQEYFGLPEQLLHLLALIPIGFALYDMLAISNKRSAIDRWLIGIAMLNICYVLLSLSMAIYHFDLLTIWAKLYLSGEIIIVLLIARWEIQLAHEIKATSN